MEGMKCFSSGGLKGFYVMHFPNRNIYFVHKFSLKCSEFLTAQ